MKRIQRRWQAWFRTRHPPLMQIRIKKNHIYVLPSAFGWLFALALLGLFIGAINYQVSAVFLFCFLLGSCALLSAWSGHQNLLDLKLSCLTIEDCPVGGEVVVTLKIRAENSKRFALQAHVKELSDVQSLASFHDETSIKLTLPVQKRGSFQLPLIKLQTQYPFGLFSIWAWL